MTRIDSASRFRKTWLLRKIQAALNARGGSMPTTQKLDMLCSLLNKATNDLGLTDNATPKDRPIIITVNGGTVNILCRQTEPAPLPDPAP